MQERPNLALPKRASAAASAPCPNRLASRSARRFTSWQTLQDGMPPTAWLSGTLQKTAFQLPKGHELHAERRPLGFIRSSGVCDNSIAFCFCHSISCVHPATSQAVGNCHSALRRGIQRTSYTSNSICGIYWIPRRSAEWQLPTAWIIVGCIC